ncbi:hypothetical protein JOQ06_009077, partial [Pogonophryne albipinna]
PVQSNVGRQQIDKQPPTQPTQPVRSSRLKPRAERRRRWKESFWPRAGSDDGAKTKTEQTHLDSVVNEQ